MIRYLTVFLFFILTKPVLCQQWISKNYLYDSILNIPYGNATNFLGGTESLKLDLYLPKCDDPAHVSRKPLLVWIHGGAFLAGDKNDVSITNLCKQFAKRGYVTASVDYRLGFVSDDTVRNCNYPNYSCVFATDKNEWERAYYRAVQDCKGALRFLINRNSLYRIDTNNVFVAGESAGAITSLGVALLDTTIERMPSTYSINSVPLPHTSMNSCSYNAGKTFTGTTIPRPDLGGIDGSIEPSNIKYTIKGIGNMYGAMFNNLLRYKKSGSNKPAIYSFHQPCDLVVPIDSAKVYWGLSLCFTNGYNCNAITKTPKVSGSRTISNWNTSLSLGYIVQNDFTSTNFPYNYWIGTGSCVDQINTPCHAYDNSVLRETNMATFFASLITTSPICNPAFSGIIENENNESLMIYPLPAIDKATIKASAMFGPIKSVLIQDMSGKIRINKNELKLVSETEIEISDLSGGVYFVIIENHKNQTLISKLVVLK